MPYRCINLFGCYCGRQLSDDHTTMIRLFLNLCKTFHAIKNKNDMQIYQQIRQSKQEDFICCPLCAAPFSQLHKNGSYERDLIFLEDGRPSYHKITVSCVFCTSCGHSHAILPSLIIPYSSYSLSFLVSLLYHRITNAFGTVEKLCLHYEISISSFYRIYKRFLFDFFQMEALLENISPMDFLKLPYEAFHPFLESFCARCGYTFLQPRVRFRQELLLGNLPLCLSRYLDNG